MNATEKQIRSFLMSYRRMLEKIEEVEEAYERIYTTATSPGGSNSIAEYVSQSGSGDKIGNDVMLLADVEEKIKRRVKKAEKRKREIQYCIDQLPGERTRRVCTLSYIDFWDRGLIARELKIGRQVVTNERAKAVKWIAENIQFKRA